VPAGRVSANRPSDEKLRSRAYGVQDGVVGSKMRCAPACTHARDGSGDALSGSWTRTDNVPVSAPRAPHTMTQRAARNASCSQGLCIRASLPDESVPAKGWVEYESFARGRARPGALTGLARHVTGRLRRQRVGKRDRQDREDKFSCRTGGYP